MHINGFVRVPGYNSSNTVESLSVWVGKRSSSKATYPGMLDVLAAGGQPRSGTTHGDTKREREGKGSGGHQEEVGENEMGVCEGQRNYAAGV